MSWQGEAFVWAAIIVAVTLTGAPLARLLGNRLRDGGVSIALPIGLLAVVFPTWYMAGIDLTPYTTIGLFVSMVILAAAGWGYVVRTRLVNRSWLVGLGISIGGWVAAFLLFIALRGYTPEILNTEKPMDAAFLASSARTTVIPPLDPWMSGERINYYYFGYLLHGAVARMADVPVSYAFNLALATTFAMTAVALAGLLLNVVSGHADRRIRFGIAALGVFLVLVAGNMFAFASLFTERWRVTTLDWWGGIGWNSSRVVNDAGASFGETINEFPAFSFVLGDLHPHVMALPFTVAVLVLALNLLRSASEDRLTSNASRARLVGAGAFTGSLYALNSWDFPTYLVILVAALWGATRGVELRPRLIGSAIIGAAAIIPWLPFTLKFAPINAGGASSVPASMEGVPILERVFKTIAWMPWERTSISEFMTVFGLGYSASLLLIAPAAFGLLSDRENRKLPGSVYLIAMAFVVLALAASAPLIILCGVPLAFGLVLLYKAKAYGLRETAIALCVVAYGLILVTEFFYIQDVFQSRMNTLFKVYYQAWTLFGVAAAITVVLLVDKVKSTPKVFPRALVGATVAVAIFAGSLYPVFASRANSGGFNDWDGLDGSAYLTSWSTGDLAAIQWLQENATPDDVLVEVPGCSYAPVSEMPTARFAVFTGVPNVIGWGGHESQWRSGQPDLHDEIGMRQDDALALLNDPSRLDIADKYGITFLVVGRWEREGRPEACDRTQAIPGVDNPEYASVGWSLVFEQDGARIYRRTTG